MAANKAQIPSVTSAELAGIDVARCGLKGSPTHVKSTFVPVHESKLVLVKEETVEDSAKKLIGLLSDAHVI